ncbi:hypothetical protein MPER_03794, partial [Moniliophthora perniciosa FA553]
TFRLMNVLYTSKSFVVHSPGHERSTKTPAATSIGKKNGLAL